jgi:hypothetical protein
VTAEENKFLFIVKIHLTRGLRSTIQQLLATISNADRTTTGNVPTGELDQRVTSVMLEFKVNRQTSKEQKSSLRIQIGRLKEEN